MIYKQEMTKCYQSDSIDEKQIGSEFSNVSILLLYASLIDEQTSVRS